MSRTFRFVVLSAIWSVMLATTLHAYGPAGHEIVGAIADERLANTRTGEKVRALLEGIPLQKAAVIPDEIKSWDKNGADDPRGFHYPAHPNIDAQLRDFWRANPPTHDGNAASPSHHWFHYTDVPIARANRYAAGKAGRTNWDVVHMIGYCVDVLRDRITAQNERKITKPVAVILLAHYVGDIHQPLHVGAEYFDAAGQIVDADNSGTSLADEGGNTVNLQLSDDPPRRPGFHKKKLHGFWDVDAVNALLPEVPQTLTKEERRTLTDISVKKLAHEMAVAEPKGWRMPPTVDPKNYAEVWVDEILPIAREAHERLIFKEVKPLQQEDRVVAAGEAEEKPGGELGAYRKWATGVVRDELHKAGWRLADLLEKALNSSASAQGAH